MLRIGPPQIDLQRREKFRMQLMFRFLVGGLVVSLFAALGGALKPKSFAGLFGASPSVALATLGLTIASNGKLYAAQEAHSMIVGAIALGLYSAVVIQLIMKHKLHAGRAASAALSIWIICALGAWLLVLR
jgi:uncharacterized membrane protein (GlpM family)